MAKKVEVCLFVKVIGRITGKIWMEYDDSIHDIINEAPSSLKVFETWFADHNLDSHKTILIRKSDIVGGYEIYDRP